MITHILTAIAAIIGVSLAFNENPHISPLWNLLGLLLLAAAYTTAFRRPNHRPQKKSSPDHSATYITNCTRNLNHSNITNNQSDLNRYMNSM